MKFMQKYLLSFILALAFIVIGIFTLHDYGINWDAPYHMMRGQAYLRFLMSGKKTYDFKKIPVSSSIIKPREFASRYDFAAMEEYQDGKQVTLPNDVNFKKIYAQNLDARYSFYQNPFWNGEYFMNEEGPGHPPTADIMSAASNRLFWGKLGLLGDLESYQFFYILVSSLAVFIVSIFTFEIIELSGANKTQSLIAAAISGICMGLSPMFFAEAHFNMKDPLQAAFFIGAVWSFWHWVKDGKLSWFVLFIVQVAFALGIKWNIIFLPFMFLPWLLAIRKTPEFRKWINVKLVLYFGLGALFCLVVISMVWPYIWVDPLHRILSVWTYYVSTGTNPNSIQPQGFILPLGFNIFPSVLLIIQTPLVILFLVVAAIIGLFLHEKDPLKTKVLLLSLLFVPLVRISLPHVWFYNGIRQIMEVIPALAILSGLGAHFLMRRVKIFPKILPVALCIFTLVYLSSIVIFYHPNENVYFNLLVGGVNGAYKKGWVDDKLTYGNVYKQAANWLNEHSAKNSNVAFTDGTMYSLSPLFLREDIHVSPYNFSGFERKGEYIVSLIKSSDPAVFAYRYPERFLKPVHTISVQGVPLLHIYKNDLPHVRETYTQESQISDISIKPITDEEGKHLLIQLPKKLKVTRITIFRPPPSCQSSYSPFVDEFIRFDGGKKYDLQERKRTAAGNVEFLFPAEEAQEISITPVDDVSCFDQGVISSISVLSQ